MNCMDANCLQAGAGRVEKGILVTGLCKGMPQKHRNWAQVLGSIAREEGVRRTLGVLASALRLRLRLRLVDSARSVSLPQLRLRRSCSCTAAVRPSSHAVP
jgi:hypothetical protein